MRAVPTETPPHLGWPSCSARCPGFRPCCGAGREGGWAGHGGGTRERPVGEAGRGWLWGGAQGCAPHAFPASLVRDDLEQRRCPVELACRASIREQAGGGGWSRASIGEQAGGGGLVQAIGQQWCRPRSARRQGQCPGRRSSGHLAWTGSQRRAGVYKGAQVVPPRGALCGGGRGWRGMGGWGQGPTPGSALDSPVSWEPQFPCPHLVRLDPGCPSQPGPPSSAYILPTDRCLGKGVA